MHGVRQGQGLCAFLCCTFLLCLFLGWFGIPNPPNPQGLCASQFSLLLVFLFQVLCSLNLGMLSPQMHHLHRQLCSWTLWKKVFLKDFYLNFKGHLPLLLSSVLNAKISRWTLAGKAKSTSWFILHSLRSSLWKGITPVSSWKYKLIRIKENILSCIYIFSVLYTYICWLLEKN